MTGTMEQWCVCATLCVLLLSRFRLLLACFFRVPRKTKQKKNGLASFTYERYFTVKL